CISFDFVTFLRRPRSTLFPYTTLFRSDGLFAGRRTFCAIAFHRTSSRAARAGTQVDARKTAIAHPDGGRKGSLHVSSVFILCLRSKSTRLNSSHVKISYAVFCLKKKTN